jgi:hypothetical protein
MVTPARRNAAKTRPTESEQSLAPPEQNRPACQKGAERRNRNGPGTPDTHQIVEPARSPASLEAARLTPISRRAPAKTWMAVTSTAMARTVGQIQLNMR